jgi:GTPase
MQHRASPEAATYIGQGKLEEVKQICDAEGLDLAVFNDELSGSQIRNIEKVVGCRVIDRTMLILDIFAAHAKSREGKLQVELAQLQYRLEPLDRPGYIIVAPRRRHRHARPRRNTA